MTGALAARGPDGEGFHVAGPVGLGHRRLAIIDVEGGHQPLYSEDGRLRSFVNVYLGDEDVRHLQHGETLLTDGAMLSIVPSVAGGVDG